MASFRENQLKDANLKKEWLDKVSKNQNQSNVFYTFLNTDIAESSEPLDFIKNVRSNIGPSFIIENRAILQINEVVDISQPKDSRNKFETTIKGTLKLLLTDGINTIIGITKKPINNQIKPSSDPGSKILLKPPVIVKYGIAFLSNDNIQFYGGKSPELMIKKRDLLKKPTNVRRIIKKPLSNDNSQQRGINNEMQKELGSIEKSNMKTSPITKVNIVSSSSSPSPSSSPTNEDKNSSSNKQKGKLGQLAIIESPPLKPNKQPKLYKSFQFLSSDESDLDSSDSYQEAPSSLSK